MKKIPLAHTLVMLIGPSGSGKSTFAEKNFTKQEVISSDALRLEYNDDPHREDQPEMIFNEFDRRIRNRLELGQRVVADATHLRAQRRKRTAMMAHEYGAKVVYVVINRSVEAKNRTIGWRENVRIGGKNLIEAHEETFRGSEPAILNGDGGLANIVIDTRKEAPEIVKPLWRQHDIFSMEQAPIRDIIARGFQGLLVVGDIHGNLEGFWKMQELALNKKLFMVMLGDIVDYAPDTLETANAASEVIFNGDGISIMGNHERKIHTWITQERNQWWYLRDENGMPREPQDVKTGMFQRNKGFTGKLSEGAMVTVNQVKAMLPRDRLVWETRFLGLCSTMPHYIRFPQYFFTHGAATPKMLDATAFRFHPKSREESFAMYGETTGEYVNGFPERIYDWVEEIPGRTTVVVGHDCRSDGLPLIQHGKAGGRAIFLDTASSKTDRLPNGHLSGMSLDFSERKGVGLILENETFYSEHDL
jgi:protein phosphatase